MDPQPAFDWAAYLHQCGSLMVQAAAWTFCARAIGAALGLIR